MQLANLCNGSDLIGSIIGPNMGRCTIQFYFFTSTGAPIQKYLTGDIFGRIKRSAEIILGGDIFGHHFTQIWALISAQYFSTLKFASVEISCFPSCKSFTKIIPILHYSVKIDDFALKYYEDPF